MPERASKDPSFPMMGTKSKKISSIQLERFYRSKATNAFGYYDLRDISEKCNININAFAAYDYQSTYIWLKVIYPCLVWILRKENAELRLRQGLVQVRLRIGPSGCVCCHGNKVSTINGVIFSSLSPPGYFSPRRGYRRVPKFCMGF